MSNVVRIRFANSYTSGSSYDFYNNLDIKTGDLVVVDTIHGYAAAEVIAVGINSSRATKWVVAKVDLTEHLNNLAQEKTNAARLKERLLVMKKMESRRAKLENSEVYARLAQTDDEMAELITQYNALTN